MSVVEYSRTIINCEEIEMIQKILAALAVVVTMGTGAVLALPANAAPRSYTGVDNSGLLLVSGVNLKTGEQISVAGLPHTVTQVSRFGTGPEQVRLTPALPAKDLGRLVTFTVG